MVHRDGSMRECLKPAKLSSHYVLNTYLFSGPLVRAVSIARLLSIKKTKLFVRAQSRALWDSRAVRLHHGVNLNQSQAVFKTCGLATSETCTCMLTSFSSEVVSTPSISLKNQHFLICLKT